MEQTLTHAPQPAFRMPARSISWYPQDGNSEEEASHYLIYYNRKVRGQMHRNPVTREWTGYFRWKGKDFITVDISLTDGYSSTRQIGNMIWEKFSQQVQAAGGAFL